MASFRPIPLLPAALLILSGAAPPPAAPAPVGAVSVANGTLLRDGKPWVPKGVVVTAPIAAAATNDQQRPAYARALAMWGPAEIAAIKAYGADSVNLKASQHALDPTSGHYDPAYAAKVQSAVHDLRQAGLTVMLSMEWEAPSGVSDSRDLPSDASAPAPLSSTARAWKAVAGTYAADMGVMDQLFDEPCAKQDDRDTWARWQQGHQAAIDAVRGTGARNVLIAEGIRCGKWLTDVPPLRDPLNALTYAVHPYQNPRGMRRSAADNFDTADFDRNFGDFQAKGHIIIATEWNIWTGNCRDGRDGTPDNARTAFNLLTYLKAHRIGLVIWAMDLPGTIWYGAGWDKPTTLEPEGCGPGFHPGAGAMVEDYFKTGTVAVH